MQQLGHTRSAHRRDHLLQTPDTFVRTPLPGMRNAMAIVHAAPARGAHFTQYTVEFAPDGSLAPGAGQRFIYVLEGELRSDALVLHADDYAYLPPGSETTIEARAAARAAVIEKPYIPMPGVDAP
jgi:(S)-ureidoglycine aminohydrolase